jgi:hypothetical protein
LPETDAMLKGFLRMLHLGLGSADSKNRTPSQPRLSSLWLNTVVFGRSYVTDVARKMFEVPRDIHDHCWDSLDHKELHLKWWSKEFKRRVFAFFIAVDGCRDGEREHEC